MKYSRDENDWKNITNFPYANGYSEAESVNGNLYVFGGNGGKRNVVKYNSDEDSWTVLPVKIPFDFMQGCSTVISDCKVLLLHEGGRNAVFDAISETFEHSSFPSGRDGASGLNKCAAALGKINNSVGVMVIDKFMKTNFFQLEPPGSGEWKTYKMHNGWLGPVLGRVSSDAMFLGGNPNWRLKNEIFHNLGTSWENMGLNIFIPTYGRNTQVPESWFK